MRLSLAVDNLEFDAEAFPHLVDEFRPIDGGAARFRRDGAGAGDAARDHLVAADAQGFERAVDRRLAEPSAGRQALAEPHDAGKGVDDAKSIGGRPRDEQPAIVGPEVKRGIGRRTAAARPRNGPRRVVPRIGSCQQSLRQNQTPAAPYMTLLRQQGSFSRDSTNPAAGSNKGAAKPSSGRTARPSACCVWPQSAETGERLSSPPLLWEKGRFGVGRASAPSKCSAR